MNTDTGEIRMMPADFNPTEREQLLRRIVSVDLGLATEKQKAAMRVSLKDHASDLGKQLTQWRSKYVPHEGAKQELKKLAMEMHR